MSFFKKMLLICLVICIVFPATAIAESNIVRSNIVRVTKFSPIQKCRTDNRTDTLYTNSEVEPWIDINPINSSNLVGIWQQDRWSRRGAQALVIGYTFNEGKNWNKTSLPFTKCVPNGLNFERTADPWISFGPDGTLYSIGLAYNLNKENAVVTSTSTDGGKSWENTKIIELDSESQYQNDKVSITADPVKKGVAYAVWDRINKSTSNGPTLFSKTTDGGKTWSEPQVIVPVESKNQTIGNQIIVDSHSGTLYNFFDLIISGSKEEHNVAFVKSLDGGKSWTTPKIISPIYFVEVTHPISGENIRTSDFMPAATINPLNGNLYVVWQDGRFSNNKYPEIAISYSSDKGESWSKPKRINFPSGYASFTPSIKINSDGVIGVTYYDFRNFDNKKTSLPTDYWFTTSTDGGKTFKNEIHLAGPFNMLSAPYASGFFIGDYQGLAVSRKNFYPFFIQTNKDKKNPTDVFTTKLTLSKH